MQIDDIFYKSDITGLDWYLERYNNNHSAICLFNNDGNIVGYLASIPIKKELYDAISNGVIINDLFINPTMFVNDSKYHYIASCVILEEYRNKKYGTMMIEKLFDNININYVALTVSINGRKLVSKYMEKILSLNDDVCVYIRECKL